MYIVKCQSLSKIQLQLTPQQSKSPFRINAERTKDNIEKENLYKRVDIVEISPEGRQMLADAMASGSWGLGQARSQQDVYTCRARPDQVYSRPE